MPEKIDEVTEVKLNEGVEIEWVDGVNDEDHYFEFEAPDEKFLLLVENGDTDDAELVLKSGDYLQKGYGDVEFTVDDFAVFQLESGVVKDDDGNVVIKQENAAVEESNLKFGLIEMSYSTA